MGNNQNTEFIIDDGAKPYSFVNPLGETFAEFSFNPADTGIVKRYEDLMKFIDNLDYSDEDLEDGKIILTVDNLLEEQFDLLFGKKMKDGLFMMYRPLTLFPDGSFYAEVILKQLGIIIEKETNTRINKKIAKIRKDVAKNRK